MTDIVLEARHITKAFPGVVANDDVSLSLHRGEILALLGENGAGKSTLMNVVYGLYRADQGEILIEGEPVQLSSPRDAIRLGIGMVHQHFQLVQPMTVTENILLGSEITLGRTPFLDFEAGRQRVRELSVRYGLSVNPDDVIEHIPVGVQQRVEILKALYRQARILILDEPTAVLTPQEIQDLFRVMRELARGGHSIIFITHKLREVLEVAHRIVAMRQGRVVGESLPESSTQATLAEMMVGRKVILQVPKGPAHADQVVLEVRDLSMSATRGGVALKDVSLEVHAGEILGVAGVQGNGQTELVEAITGLRHVQSGAISMNGSNVTAWSPRQRSSMGMAYIPEDRHRFGMVGSYSVAENLVLNTYHLEPYSRRGVRDDAAIRDHAEQLVQAFDIRTPTVDTAAGSLSGGNQQKLVVARELGREVSLLVASQPTRGVDVGSIEFIHRQIVAQRDRGIAVLLVSAELDEILTLSDRIAVLYEGEIIATVEASQATREQLGLLMAGVRAPLNA
ncbi:MAG: ABC transporter ATP-binding protein [Chloroflexi bacterium]|nr:ABC transporter ATP-binding protein [Chloroflexota bacterium]